MTIAERLRIEMQSKVDFNATLLMEKVTEHFKEISYGADIEIISYSNKKELCGNSFYTLFFQGSDSIFILSEHFNHALKMFIREGFYLYRVNEHCVRMSLEKYPYLSYGINKYFRIDNI